MKRLKVNFLALAAVVVAAGTMAFAAPVNQEWVFTGDSQSQILDASFYSLSEPLPTGCDANANLPCSIRVEAQDEQELQDYLDSKTSGQIMNEATGHRD
ncbi:hypothetical protein [Pontibacter mangrovi]|uniref:Uncharacterized protein n=1 Tax=Pontibacter mangrovi TaxID=2589816 RepID=A0A501W1E7_9BACT|nr:hypothetical protein [Pontibacter mangrovi]TPE42415.1 hypothetical protein FJM65_18510 [Pontibacter mangrovi]